MMLQNSIIENQFSPVISPTATKLDWNKIATKLVSFIGKSQSLLQGSSLDTPNENESLKDSTVSENISARTSIIYVCTFCQVFSSKNDAIKEHIASAHHAALPNGATAEAFISKLQALNNENKKKSHKKGGRPRKTKSESPPLPVEKLPVPDPVPGPDGFYWCQKCMKYFKKSRQLSMHVCLELEDDDALSDDSDGSVISDESGEFRPHMDVEPTPWTKRPKFSRKETKQMIDGASETMAVPEEQISDKTILHWREDPAYVPLFGNDTERQAFEMHLKSIDYSCVDNLFMKEGKRIVGRRKKGCLHNSISIYTCILCKKVLNSLTHIRMHCLTHTEIKPFTCPKCEYRCNTKGSLYTHMRTHTGNVFRCSRCNFKCTKRAHLLDHEETHSGISHLCHLCKNSYKTLKSLIAHVKKYHTNPGGKKFIKLLTSKDYKETIIQCKICTKKFMSQSAFNTHNRKEHTVNIMPSETEIATKMIQDLSDGMGEEIKNADSSLVPTPNSTLEPLAEIVLNDLLQQKNTVPIELYEDVFPRSPDSGSIPETTLSSNFVSDTSSQRISSLNDSSQFHPAKDVLVECDKDLNLEILDECLSDPDFTEEVIAEVCKSPKLPSECQEGFNLPQISLNFTNDPLIASKLAENGKSMSKELVQLSTDELADKSCPNENKADEIKLFEKCRRAPAYVCCVCSGIFICPSTLKAHLREHINTTSSLIEQAAEDFAREKLSENDSDLDNVCGILQDPSETCADGEKELEKLYSSSLDMIWYLPEVSVVLENDPAIFDSVLDDISNFPMTD